MVFCDFNILILVKIDFFFLCKILYKVGMINRVKIVDEIMLLMIIVVRGCWIFEFIFVFNVIGIKFNEVISVVVNIGWRWVNVLLKIVLLSVKLFLCSFLINDIIISLLRIVMFDKVIKLIVVEIENGILCNNSVVILLVNVSGIFVKMIMVFLNELSVRINKLIIMIKVIGIIIFRCFEVDCSFW